jgi:hypothetical protein
LATDGSNPYAAPVTGSSSTELTDLTAIELVANLANSRRAVLVAGIATLAMSVMTFTQLAWTAYYYWQLNAFGVHGVTWVVALVGQIGLNVFAGTMFVRYFRALGEFRLRPQTALGALVESHNRVWRCIAIVDGALVTLHIAFTAIQFLIPQLRT